MFGTILELHPGNSLKGVEMLSRISLLSLVLLMSVAGKADFWSDRANDLKNIASNPGQAIGDVLKTTVKGFQDTGNYVFDGIHQGGGYVGDGVNQGAGALAKGTGDLLHGPFQLIDGAGKWTAAGLDQFAKIVGDGLGAYAKFFKLRADELKTATPFIARMYACIVTVCLSEVQLKQDQIELRHKMEQELADLKAQLAKASKDEKQRMGEEYIATLTKIISEMQNENRIYSVETGYYYDFHFRVLGEIDKRKTLADVGEAVYTSIDNVTQGDPRLAKLTKFAAASKDATDQNFLKYYSLVDQYSRALKIEVTDTVNLIVKNMSQEDLKKLDGESWTKAQGIQKNSDALTTELNNKIAELGVYKKQFQPSTAPQAVAKK
jgi:cell division protein ZapA (FtsZ GTPase activity inhibitor)